MYEASQNELKKECKAAALYLAICDKNAAHTNVLAQNIASKISIFATTSSNDCVHSIGNSIDQSLSPIQTNNDFANKQPIAERFDLVIKIISNIRQDLLGCDCVKDIENDNVHICSMRSNLISQINEVQVLIDGIRAQCVRNESHLALITEAISPETSPGKSKVHANQTTPEYDTNSAKLAPTALACDQDLSSHTKHVHDEPHTVKDLAFIAQQQRDIDEINKFLNRLELPTLDLTTVNLEQLKQLKLMCHECSESLKDEQATIESLTQLTAKLIKFIQTLVVSSNTLVHEDAQKFLVNREKLQWLKALESKLGRYERTYCLFGKQPSYPTSKAASKSDKTHQKLRVRRLNMGLLCSGSSHHFDGDSLHVQGTWFINTDYLMYLLASSISGLELKVQVEAHGDSSIELLEQNLAPKFLTSAVNVKMSIPFGNSNQEYGAFMASLQVPLDSLPITPTSSMPLAFVILMLESFRTGILPYTWRQILGSWGRYGHACLEYGHSNYARSLEVMVETIFRPMDLAATKYLLCEEAKCILCMDETVTRVLVRPDTTSPKRQYSLIVVIEFLDEVFDQLSHIVKIVDLNGRSAEKIQNALKANNVLELFENEQVVCVMSDCYAGYTFIESKAPRAACFAHCIRRFRLACDTIHAKIKGWLESGLSSSQIIDKYGNDIPSREQIMIRITRLFDTISTIEHTCHAEAEALLNEPGIDRQSHSAKYLSILHRIRAERRKISLQCLDGIEELCNEFVGDSIIVSPKTGAAKVALTADKDLIVSAVCYFLNAKDNLRNALLEPRCDLTNNYCERIAKAVTLPFKQRKMCFQTESQLHNHLSAQSFWETCLANKRNPAEVLTWLHYIVSMTQYGLYLRDRACAGIDTSTYAQNAVQFRDEVVVKLDYLGMFKRIISGRPLSLESANDFIARVTTKPFTQNDGKSTMKAKDTL